MSKKLWSINAIASELDRDRRTVTTALADVPPDGKIAGNRAWYLDSAVRALSRHGSNDRSEDPAESRLLGHFTDRVVNFGDLELAKSGSSSRGVQIDFDMAVTVFADGKPDRVLTWLKAGLPYWTEGEWETGKGFVFIAHWIVDFLSLIGREIRESGDRRSARVLDMTGALR